MEMLAQETELINALNWRYATKKFDTQKKIDEQEIAGLLEATRLSASSFGLQPYRLIHVENQHTREELRAVSYNQAQITDASHLVVFAAATNLGDAYVEHFIDLIAGTRGIEKSHLAEYDATMKGTISRLDAAARISWPSKQAYIAIGTLLSAAALAGIDACPMEGFVANEYNRILKLEDENLTALAVVALGYRAQDDSYQHFKKVRYDAAEFILGR